MNWDDIVCFEDYFSLATCKLSQKQRPYKKQCGELAPQGASPYSQAFRILCMAEQD